MIRKVKGLIQHPKSTEHDDIQRQSHTHGIMALPQWKLTSAAKQV